MTERLLRFKHEVAVYDIYPDVIKQYEAKGAIGCSSPEDLFTKLENRKIIWLMLPAGRLIDDYIEMMIPFLKKDDIIIDGGNSYYKDSIRRYSYLNSKGIRFIDCGVSGGVWGLKNGYGLMYGGDKEACIYCEEIFKALAPEKGYLYCGISGTGHFVKMVHNGIEYGIMQSYAEGFDLLYSSPFKIDLDEVSDVWQYGTVIRSWLLELIHNAFKDDPKLERIDDYVEDSGEGRWTIEAALEYEVPLHAISSSLFTRFESREKQSFAMKLVAALRNQFGGHSVKHSNDK